MSSVDDLLDLKPFSPPRSALEPGLDEPIFSIIVPTRNRPVSLRTALEAIKQQTFSGFEVIVIDDGSRTECRTEYAVLQKTLDSRFRLISVSPDGSPGSGPAAARNFGISLARGEYVGFCDDDDYWCADDHLAVAAEALAAVPEADIYYANQTATRRGALISADRWPQLDKSSKRAAKIGSADVCQLPRDVFLRPGGVAHLNISIVRRSLIQAIGGFWQQLRYDEDFDFYLRSIDQARSILYRPTIVAHHLAPDQLGQDNASTQFDRAEKLLAQCMACEHARVTSRTREVLALSRFTQGYALRHLTMALYKDGRYSAAATAAAQALAILPGVRWSVFVAYLNLRRLRGSRARHR